MLRSVKKSYDAKLIALDGEIGQVKDFYFDDQEWVVRYVVADTGSWLSGHSVLLSPRAVGDFSEEGHHLGINLTMEKIKGSPPIDDHKPVSRQVEEVYHHYYEWPSYWEAGGMWGAVGLGVAPPPHVNPMKEESRAGATRHGDDPYLRSTKAVAGYYVKTPGEEIGHVTDFMFDDKNWAIGHLVVHTGSPFSGKDILISPRDIERISYEDSTVFMHASKEAPANAEQSQTPGA